jgi:hypothetical protein
MSTLDGCDGKKRIEFHSSNGVVAERHISTPWRDPEGPPWTTSSWSAGMASVTLIGIPASAVARSALLRVVASAMVKRHG